MAYPDNFSARYLDAQDAAECDRNRYEEEKFREACDTLTKAWDALRAAKAAFANVYVLRHDYETGHSYDPDDFCGSIEWEMKTVADVAKAYGVVLEGV